MMDISQVRIFLCLLPTKMTYSFDSLMGMAEEIFDQDPNGINILVSHLRVSSCFSCRRGFVMRG